MDQKHLSNSLAAVFLLLCLYYCGGITLLPIVAIPIAVHELSHILTLRLLGQKITRLSLDARGICMYYDGSCSAAGHVLAALAGPLGGALYAAAADRLSRAGGGGWLEQSAGVSLLQTAFNLLPVMPLDGGRVFSQLCAFRLGEERGKGLSRSVSTVTVALLLIGGVALALWKKSTAPLAAAIWLLLFQNEEEALVKSGEIR